MWTQGPSEGGGGKAGTLVVCHQHGASQPDHNAVEELLERLSIQSQGAMSKRLPTLPAPNRGERPGRGEDEYDAVGIYDTDDSGGSRD